jgi:hypothetical protein
MKGRVKAPALAANKNGASSFGLQARFPGCQLRRLTERIGHAFDPRGVSDRCSGPMVNGREPVPFLAVHDLRLTRELRVTRSRLAASGASGLLGDAYSGRCSPTARRRGAQRLELAQDRTNI